MNDLDTKPWYRQFWPWFIIALPASAVVASLYTVSLAVRTTDSLVMTSEDGVDVVTSRNLAAERVAADLGIRATLAIDLESGAIEARLVADEPLDPPKTLQLLFSHPAFANLDRIVTLTAAMPDTDGTPVWSGHLVDVPDGRWYVILTDGDSWRLTGSWSGAAALHLEPAGAADDGQG
jgi:hypothetical protein